MRRSLERSQQLEQKQKRWSWGGALAAGSGERDGEWDELGCIADSKLQICERGKSWRKIYFESVCDVTGRLLWGA